MVQNGTDSTVTKTQASTVETTITSCSNNVCSTVTKPVSSKAQSTATSVTSSASRVIDVTTNGANKFNNGVFGAAAIAGAAALLL